MRLIEAIIDANHRALQGDKSAGLRVAEYAGEMPLVAMTCIDPRLNALFPGVMGLPAEGFIWLRNAGNIIFGPLSSMTRSLALACAVKGGREIAIIGHTDCQVTKVSISELVERFRALGVERNQLPDNLTEYFGVFSSERKNVIDSVAFVRQSPLISPTMPVQGLMVDVNTGKLEWVVNGYEALERAAAQKTRPEAPEIGGVLAKLGEPIGLCAEGLKLPDVKIGEIATGLKQGLTEVKEASPPAIPIPPPIRPKQELRGLK